MFGLSFHIRCILLFSIVIQSVFLYKIHLSDDNQQLASSSSSLNQELDPVIQNQNPGFINDDDENNEKNLNEWKMKSKRSIVPISMQYRKPRAHWNPLVAAYKRCAELISPPEREMCFKDAVQMLFVHKLRK